MRRKPTFIALAVASVAMVLVATAPALAITGGSPDRVHTNVGWSASPLRRVGSAVPAP
jgi:hypothetical protein